jgi:hypothetical protein
LSDISDEEKVQAWLEAIVEIYRERALTVLAKIIPDSVPGIGDPSLSHLMALKARLRASIEAIHV